MALNPGRISRTVSPSNSDISSPKGYVSPLKDQDDDLKKDRTYRRYAAGVERSLSLFDTALQEWADYISFLSRLLKALQAHPEGIKAIPHKALVAKRLAQCMNPALPSGVHQKTLELYDFIFTLLGEDALGRDLLLYFPGIASTLGFASLVVRPLFLSLVHDHLLKVPVEYLRPALKAIILALLPGLEEETSEDFERCLSILTQFRKAFEKHYATDDAHTAYIGGAYFWQCLFLTSITGPSRRMGVLAYLTRYLPRLGSEQKTPGSQEETEHKISIAEISTPEPGLLLRCFATGLVDDQVLVQRTFLDLLVTHIPLHAQQLQSPSVHDDLVLLVTSALVVVLRRDMSLNRRLWSWFLGPEPTSPTNGHTKQHLRVKSEGDDLGYFTRYGVEAVTESILKMIAPSSNNPSIRAKPFRIALSLMDRWEVGGIVVPTVFIPLLQSVKSFEISAPSKEAFEEVFRSSNVFFDGVESVAIWGDVFELLDFNDKPLTDEEKLNNAELVDFIITRFNIREEEMLALHIPLVILALVNILEEHEGQPSSADQPSFTPVLLEKLLQILLFLLETVPESAMVSKSIPAAEVLSKHSTIVDKIRDFYIRSRSAIDLPEPPFTRDQISSFAMRECCSLTSKALKTAQPGKSLNYKIQILCTLAQKVTNSKQLLDADIGALILDRLSNPRDSQANGVASGLPFSLLSCLSSLTIFLQTGSSNMSYLKPEQLGKIVSMLVRHLWYYLDPSTPQVHVEAVICILQLHTAVQPGTHVSSALSTLMSSPDSQKDYFLPGPDAIRHFSVLWTHAMSKPVALAAGSVDHLYGTLLDRPLDLVIDVLSQPREEGFEAAKEWLQAQSSLSRIFDAVMPSLQTLVSSLFEKGSGQQGELALCGWQIRRLRYLISAQTDDQWRTFAKTTSNHQPGGSVMIQVAQLCMKLLQWEPSNGQDDEQEMRKFSESSIEILVQLLSAPTAYLLADLEIDKFLIARLGNLLDRKTIDLQNPTIDCLALALKVRMSTQTLQDDQDDRRSVKEGISTPRMSISERRASKDKPITPPVVPPKELLKCLLRGISVVEDLSTLQKWITLLCDSITWWADGVFQIILSVVECFIKRIQAEFDQVVLAFTTDGSEKAACSDGRLLQLLNGLEFCIAHSHDQLVQDEEQVPAAKTPEVSQGFFSNIVSNTVSTETNQIRNAIANNRLTVILCFQDITKMTFSIWAWDRAQQKNSSQSEENNASFKHTMLKLRNRCRRILEHLVAAEPLETIETLIELWTIASRRSIQHGVVAVLNLLHTLEATRPRNAMPAIFNASYSRTNPNAIDPTRKSSLTSQVSDADLLEFLIVYSRSLEDDVLEEIWADCTTFLRDILANPMPHRQILPRLLEFVAVLSAKMENTNFGEEWKMRRDLGDLFNRLLTAIFTIKPAGLSQDSITSTGSDDVVRILNETFPALVALLGESDRLASSISAISANINLPAFKARSFPQNISLDLLSLLLQMTKIPVAAKVWRRDLLEAFNDPRVFQCSPELLEKGWFPLFRQLILVDKDRLVEVLTRIVAPTTAGIMFGVGASAARAEADKRTQVNLRRVAAMILCAENDTFASQYAAILAKLEELLTATSITSPSSATRAEVFMVIRAMVLKSSSIHLAALWPTVSAELYDAFTTLMESEAEDSADSSKYTPFSLVQAAKLLDILLLIRPEDFQIQEWLFVTDTMDAIYPPSSIPVLKPTSALADDVGVALQSLPLPKRVGSTALTAMMTTHSLEPQKPFLASSFTRDGQIVGSSQATLSVLLRPFFSQLSIHAMESTYALGKPDIDGASDDLRQDLVFNVSSE